MSTPHIRIEKLVPATPGKPHVVTNDRIFACADDAFGTEIDISSAVAEWREISAVGEARRVELVLYGVTVGQLAQTEGAA